MAGNGADSATACDLNRAVQDVMNKEPRTVPPQASLLAAAEIMFKDELHHLVLADASRKVTGVVSQRDLLMQLIRVLATMDQASEQPSPESVGTVGELIASPPITVSPDLPMFKAAAMLVSKKIGCLPVVDEHGCLLGLLGISEVLSAVTRKIGLQEFEFFAPNDGTRRKSPAYFRRMSRSLVLPLESLGDVEPSLQYAQLGYNQATGRIVVKLIADQCEGSRKIGREKEFLTIPASDFVTHYAIKFDGGAYEILNQTGYYVLTPKQPGGELPAASAPRRRI